MSDAKHPEPVGKGAQNLQVYGKLHECAVSDLLCPHMFSFGYSLYCGWLLHNYTETGDNRPPCPTCPASDDSGTETPGS